MRLLLGPAHVQKTLVENFCKKIRKIKGKSWLTNSGPNTSLRRSSRTLMALRNENRRLPNLLKCLQTWSYINVSTVNYHIARALISSLSDKFIPPLDEYYSRILPIRLIPEQLLDHGNIQKHTRYMPCKKQGVDVVQPTQVHCSQTQILPPKPYILEKGYPSEAPSLSSFEDSIGDRGFEPQRRGWLPRPAFLSQSGAFGFAPRSQLFADHSYLSVCVDVSLVF